MHLNPAVVGAVATDLAYPRLRFQNGNFGDDAHLVEGPAAGERIQHFQAVQARRIGLYNGHIVIYESSVGTRPQVSESGVPSPANADHPMQAVQRLVRPGIGRRQRQQFERCHSRISRTGGSGGHYVPKTEAARIVWGNPEAARARLKRPGKRLRTARKQRPLPSPIGAHEQLIQVDQGVGEGTNRSAHDGCTGLAQGFYLHLYRRGQVHRTRRQGGVRS